MAAFDDTEEDDGEMVELGFGTLPDGFLAGSPIIARVRLVNDDVMYRSISPLRSRTATPTLPRTVVTPAPPSLSVVRSKAGLDSSDDIDAIRVEFTAGSNGHRVSLRNEANQQIPAEDFYIGMVHPDDGWMHRMSATPI